MSTRCTRARALAFDHKLEAGRQSVRAISRIMNDMRYPSDIFLTCMWVCMGLHGSTCSECLPADTCDIEPPENVPRTSARAPTCAVVCSGGLLACPGADSTRKDRWPEDKKNADVQQNTLIYRNTCLLFLRADSRVITMYQLKGLTAIVLILPVRRCRQHKAGHDI